MKIREQGTNMRNNWKKVEREGGGEEICNESRRLAYIGTQIDIDRREDLQIDTETGRHRDTKISRHTHR